MAEMAEEVVQKVQGNEAEESRRLVFSMTLRLEELLRKGGVNNVVEREREEAYGAIFILYSRLDGLM